MKRLLIRVLVLANSLTAYLLLPSEETYLGIYILFSLLGWMRSYRGSPDTPRLVGVLHNALALPIIFVAEFLLFFQFGMHTEWMLHVFFSLGFGILYFYGFRRWGWRLLVWVLIAALSYGLGYFGSSLAVFDEEVSRVWNWITILMAAQTVDLVFEGWEWGEELQ